ncbi:MAG: hypothetical protein EOR60_31180 [Mesorhizobium sp.]|nr:MAG: hypothetical protein EOR60_31180 [Mesorhizobium sp.]
MIIDGIRHLFIRQPHSGTFHLPDWMAAATGRTGRFRSAATMRHIFPGRSSRGISTRSPTTPTARPTSGSDQFGDRHSVDDVADENRVSLNGLLRSPVVRFTYIYDFGDNWQRIRKKRAGGRGGSLSGLYRG